MVGEHRCQLFLRKVRAWLALLALPHRTPPPCSSHTSNGGSMGISTAGALRWKQIVLLMHTFPGTIQETVLTIAAVAAATASVNHSCRKRHATRSNTSATSCLAVTNGGMMIRYAAAAKKIGQARHIQDWQSRQGRVSSVSSRRRCARSRQNTPKS